MAEELRHFWSSTRPRRHPVREVVVGDAHVATGEPQYLATALESFVVMLMQEGHFARADFPREAVLGAAVVMYLGEVQNGGHAQFVSNSEADPILFEDVRDGLAMFGLDAVQSIWARLEAYQKREPRLFLKADWRDPVLQELDAALNSKLHGAYAHVADQIASWPFLRVLPEADAADARRALIELSP